MKKTHGFTIVELLIVIVVIAILAAITIVSYNGISAKAKESSLKTDLTTNAKRVEMKRTTDSAYPADQASADIKSSNGNTLSYTATQKGYCIEGRNGSLTYKITNSGSILEDDCYERVWVTKGATGPSSCGSNCYYAAINTQSFTPGTYKIRCLRDGGSPSNYNTYTLQANGSVQLTCYYGITGWSISAEIEGWGISEPLTW